jgi:hypothetical protein
MISINNTYRLTRREEVHIPPLLRPLQTICTISLELCPCNTEPMSVDHVLTRCRKLATLRGNQNTGTLILIKGMRLLPEK